MVEQWDVTAADPRLLVQLKSYRNSIPVPRHWCQKRKFLMGKRGVEKPPFKLPEFIEATGIARIRAAVMEKEAGKKLKGKTKDATAGRMGKIDIDYQVGGPRPPPPPRRAARPPARHPRLHPHLLLSPPRRCCTTPSSSTSRSRR